MLSLFRKPKPRQDGRPTAEEIEIVIKQRQQVVAGLAAHEIDLSIDTLETIFSALESMTAGDKMLILSSDREHPIITLHGVRA